MPPVRSKPRKSPRSPPTNRAAAVASPPKPATVINPPPRLTKTPKRLLSHWHDLLARRDLSRDGSDEEGTDYDDFPELGSPSTQSPYSPYEWDEEREGEGAFERYKRITNKMTPGKRIEGWREEQSAVGVYDSTVSPVKTMIRNPALHLSRPPTPNVPTPRPVAPPKRKPAPLPPTKANKENRIPARRRSSSATKVGPQMTMEDRMYAVIETLTRNVKAMGEEIREEEEGARRARRAKRARQPTANEEPAMPAAGRKRKQASEPEQEEAPKKRQRTASAEQRPLARLNSTRKPAGPSPALEIPTGPLPRYITRQTTIQQAIANVHVTRRMGLLIEQGKVTEALHLPASGLSAPDRIQSSTDIERLCTGCGHVFATKHSLARHCAGARARLECRA